MTPIEELYENAIDQMTPAERMARAAGLFNWAREFLGREIRRDHPEASEARLKLLVALRMYGREPAMRQLIEKELASVSG